VVTSLLIGIIYGLINGLFGQTQSQQRTVSAVQQEETTSQILLTALHGIVLVLDGSNATTLYAEIETGIESPTQAGNSSGPSVVQYSQLVVEVNPAVGNNSAYLTVTITPATSGPVTVTTSDLDFAQATSTGIFSYLLSSGDATSTTSAGSSGNNGAFTTVSSLTTPTNLGEVVGVNLDIPFISGSVTATSFDQISTLETTVYLAGPGGQQTLSAGVPTTTLLTYSNTSTGSNTDSVTVTGTVSPAPLDGALSTASPTTGGSLLVNYKLSSASTSQTGCTITIAVGSGSGSCTITGLSKSKSYTITGTFQGTVTNSALNITVPNDWNAAPGEYAATQYSSATVTDST
jgi:hypothetical protein